MFSTVFWCKCSFIIWNYKITYQIAIVNPDLMVSLSRKCKVKKPVHSRGLGFYARCLAISNLKHFVHMLIMIWRLIFYLPNYCFDPDFSVLTLKPVNVIVIIVVGGHNVLRTPSLGYLQQLHIFISFYTNANILFFNSQHHSVVHKAKRWLWIQIT